MALKEKQLLFIDEYVNKGKTGKSNSTIATEIGVSLRTVQRYLEDEEVKREINRRASSVLDTMIPHLITNAESLLCSSNANDKAKGNDIALKLMDKLSVSNEVAIIDREKILVKEFIEKAVTNSIFLKDIDHNMFLEVCCSVFINEILLKGYNKHSMTRREIEEFIDEAEATKKSLDKEAIREVEA